MSHVSHASDESLTNESCRVRMYVCMYVCMHVCTMHSSALRVATSRDPERVDHQRGGEFHQELHV